ncbi:ABC transporter substrate-binding protein [Candidatus Raskinella chloraquaticus]|uniref:ABC transporter substrate-binding protein n=1 Tax=Candidatus Raskinella chloraquaticus TaxID=1951219 RepID=A0A1W9HUD9_9HYPH|nr:MAG: ABC transporter substrate-binding protein [Proteobacteria bacterium SG_bin8]
MTKGSLTRRHVLAGAGAGATMLAIPAAWADVDYKKYAGSKIETNLIKGPRGDLLQKYEKEFTALTGIEVNSEVIPEQQQRQKIVIELSSGRPSFDVVHISFHVQKRLFERAKWLSSVTPFMTNAALTEADHKGDDYSSAGRTYATVEGGFNALPWSVDYFMVYWNKELFQKKGIAYPTNFDELIKAAEALHDPANGISGFVGRGLRNANLPLYMSFLLGFGKDALDEKGNLIIDGPEAVEAAKIYKHLLTKCAPAGVAGFNWMESQASFLQGKSAMWLDGIGWAPPGEDPTRSRIVGKIGYGVIPKGPVAHASPTYGDGIGIPAASAKKEQAWLYCQWAVSRLMGGRLLQSGGGVPFRNSVIGNKDTQAGVTMPAEWLTCVIESAKVSKLGLPVVVPVTEFRDIIGTALTATLSGADPATELKKAADQYRPILEKSEKS